MLVIGLNQTIDRTLRLDSLVPGDVLRALDVSVTPGGKAVNVCRAASTLDVPARLVGPFPGKLGQFATGLLAAEHLDVIAVRVGGEIRGTTVVIERSGRSTVINEPGPHLDAGDWRRVVDAVSAELLHSGMVVAISGSAPPGAPADAHRQLIELVHAAGGFVAVDVTGERLLASARAGADLLSPNLAEAEAALAGPVVGGDRPQREVVESDADDTRPLVAARASAAAAALVEAGAAAVIVSAGHHGAAYHASAGSGFVDAPAVDVVNPIGAGDALLGATLAAIEQGRALPDSVRAGVAYAAASVAHPVAGYADTALMADLGATA